MEKEKKEIGMEKLIELLNEYRNDGVEEYLENIKSFKIKGGHYSDLYVISKKFGFIKWLVENDKIDKKKIDTRLVKSVESHYDEEGYWVENSYEDYSYTDTILMLLSISDTPTEDLLLYLK